MRHFKSLILQSPRRTPTWTLLLAVALTAAAAGHSSAADVSVYESVLREKNISPTSEALAIYLRELHPSDEQLATTTKLIEQLGDSDSFQAREAAMAKLLIMPTLPTEALLAAAAGDDPEIRWRAQKVLAIGKPESAKVLYAALRVIGEKKLAGLTPQLLAAVPLCDKRHLLIAAGDALTAAAGEEDADILRAALKSENEEVRAAAARAIGKVAGEAAVGDLTPLLKDKADKVQLAAARALANRGDRRSLPALLALLESDDLLVRVSASVALRQVSGQRFTFAAYDTAERRAAAIKQWRTWVAGDGQTAKLVFPLREFGGAGYLGGNTLLAYGHANKVEELSPDGKEIWSYTGQSVWGAEKLANGNVLVAELQGNRVVEVDPQGKIVWEFQVNNPLNVKPLDNGNILIAEHNGNRALEVSPDKKIVWQFQTQASCSDVHRLENGNTLIACYGSPIIEVTPEGKTVWEYPQNNCYGCQPLANGNVLIACFNENKVIEVNREKEIVWEFGETNPSDCFRTADGNTLITSGQRFIEVTPDKKVVWTKNGCQYGAARK